MSSIGDLQATKDMLRELARIVKTTRQTLAAMLAENRRAERAGLEAEAAAGRLSDTLEHMEQVREGFILSQRTTPHTALSELRALVAHILTDWSWLQSMNLALAPAMQVEELGEQLVAFNHALVALSILPRLPADAVTFPQPRPTYGDVAVPVLPGDLLARIEEIERTIYQAELRSLRRLEYAPLRRTYAFFDASSWLVNNFLVNLLQH
ncbi:MAG: hypothetical protein D6796_11445 [Caldilineae bacterium]|nr:MAG: hypothetical protein D6796_11445 [Caldilineae bacterium]